MLGRNCNGMVVCCFWSCLSWNGLYHIEVSAYCCIMEEAFRNLLYIITGWQSVIIAWSKKKQVGLQHLFFMRVLKTDSYLYLVICWSLRTKLLDLILYSRIYLYILALPKEVELSGTYLPLLFVIRLAEVHFCDVWLDCQQCPR